jgi:hypothetical protein
MNWESAARTGTRPKDGNLKAYYFRELPKLVIAAEPIQPDEVILEYEDLPDDDEIPGDGERDLMAALDAVRADRE